MVVKFAGSADGLGACRGGGPGRSEVKSGQCGLR